MRDGQAQSEPVLFDLDLSPNAPWRIEATRRIEAHRKGDLRIRVRDSRGRPVPGVPVRAEMRRHAFPLGCSFRAEWLADASLRGEHREHAVRYRRWAELLFNRGTLGVGYKWRQQTDPADRVYADAATTWMRSHGMDIHAHVMMWPTFRWGFMPKEVREYLRDESVPREAKARRLREITLEHIRAVGRRYRGLVSEWDVLNENFSEYVISDVVHPDMPIEEAPILLEWFRAAREADPHARLYVNDYGILVGDQKKHKESFERLIRYLLDNDAPLGGIGLQGHYVNAWQRRTPAQLMETLDRFARLGLPVQVTEFDMWGEGWGETKEQADLAQARYMEMFYTMLFSHPSVNGITMWGFWDGRHWMDNAPLFFEDWTPKRGFEVYQRLVFGEWWTRRLLSTDSAGLAQVRGFLGQYRVCVGTGASVEVRNVSLDRDGEEVIVVLGPGMK